MMLTLWRVAVLALLLFIAAELERTADLASAIYSHRP